MNCFRCSFDPAIKELRPGTACSDVNILLTICDECGLMRPPAVPPKCGRPSCGSCYPKAA